MKNYYEILQVNENASIEIIEKAYKVLVKKYHPDLQKDAQKKQLTEKRLQDKYGEKNYGTEKNNFYNIPKKTNIEESKKKTNNKPNNNLWSIVDFIKVLYHDRPRRQEYKEMTKKDLLAIFLTIIVVICLGIILWCIPFTNGWMRELTIENPIFKWIGGFFK